MFSAGATEGWVLADVCAFYRGRLAESPDALGWLERRRVADQDALERFQVGFSDRTLGKHLAGGADGRAARDALARLGVLRDTGHEHFRGCLTFPVVDAAGGVVQLYGRTLLDDERLGAGRHRWLPLSRRGVWNQDGLGGEVIVTGGVVEALVWWCAGFRSVTAVDGPGGFGDELAETFAAAGVGRVLIAFDHDALGDAGAREVAFRLGCQGVSVARVVFPPGAGTGSTVMRAKQPHDVFGRLVRQAEWVDTTPAWRPAPSRPSRDAQAPVVPVVETLPLSAPFEQLSVGPPSSGVVGEVVLVVGDRRWRVRGLAKVSSFDSLRVSVMVGRGERFHVDALDLYTARARAAFITAAAIELGVDEASVKADLGRVLLACEIEAERAVREAQAPVVPVVVELSEAERVEALELLRDPNLIARIVADVGRVGIVGETSNAVVGYLAAVSRKLDHPLAVVVQSTSAAGKSALVDAVLGFVPPEELVRYSAMTGQSLFYMGGGDLAHKVLAVAEEEGASRAAYALKLLQSDGELSIASTGKDGVSGRLVTHTYRVQGPTAIFLTTTAIDVDEELLNRCLVLTVDESTAQTRAIHARQRAKETLAGLVGGRERDHVIAVHRNAQRLLESVAVVNPFAEQLSFADASTRMRRDHAKYLGLIRAVTLLHQHQRTRRTVSVDGAEVVYVETALVDIEIANRVAHDVLGRSLDALPPQTRRLLDLLHGYVVEHRSGDGGVRFTRREVRERLGWGDTQLKVHLARLVDLELVTAIRGDNGGYVYELAWHGQGVDGSRFVIGLADPDQLGSSVGRSVPGRGPVGVRSGRGRTTNDGSSVLVKPTKQAFSVENSQNPCSPVGVNGRVIPVTAVG